MSEFKQPWRPIKLDGRRARLQILDPAAAFIWEPILIDALGDTLSFAIAAPDHLFGAVFRRSAAGASIGMDLRAISTDPVCGPEMARESIQLLGRIVARSFAESRVEAATVKRAFHDMVIGRLEVEREPVEESEDWVRLKLSPAAKWAAIGLQIRQTFGPLWMRSPYTLRSKVKDYGVPVPVGVPIAVRWADNLARNGSASSSREILREWTPVEMIEVVENSAYQAELERRASEADR